MRPINFRGVQSPPCQRVAFTVNRYPTRPGGDAAADFSGSTGMHALAGVCALGSLGPGAKSARRCDVDLSVLPARAVLDF